MQKHSDSLFGNAKREKDIWKQNVFNLKEKNGNCSFFRKLLLSYYGTYIYLSAVYRLKVSVGNLLTWDLGISDLSDMHPYMGLPHAQAAGCLSP